ncbi:MULTISPECIES: NUDIX hydrolase [unclassified Kitasatospora]|uniref:NUDIX domain-containing protein n=1 Tax=unclassified Kitasatospora TaxID=2633591 RepID=UPI00070B16DB|nr:MULTISPECIES: NUDIX hydrolase [unclassified Kitasatospora]KQV19993.1 ADP-ribose pyrophosphatase [Kitasatospora sp. Root107]KRB71274.1 ADP-ribose pyrophosphatase [Kitasatospora sp. Root187]
MTDGQRQIRDQAEEWPVRSSEQPFQGRVTGVRTDEVLMPDGSYARRDYQTHPGSVAVLAVDEQQRVLILRQYRHPVRQRLWELPAGLLDVPGENPLHAAQRELFEEAHCKAGEWRVLVDFYTSPGGTDEALRLFLATDLSAADGDRYEAHGEELEIETARVPLGELLQLVLTGELHNPTLITGTLALHAALTSPAGLDALRAAESPWPARPFS